MIRFIIVAIAVALYLILLIPLALVALIVGLISPHAKDMLGFWVVKIGFNAALFLSGVKATVIGYDKIPRDKAVLYVGNHRSFYDVIFTGARFFAPGGYIAKKELGKVPLLSWWMAYIHCKFLDRTDMKAGLQMVLESVEDIKNGISIFVFPEGTRNKGEEGTLLPFHKGSLKIAEKAACPIVPVAISNSQEIFEAHFPKIKSTHIVVEYCDPVYPAELSKEERKGLSDQIRNTISDKLREHKENHLF
ncbi:lysophospholipid acyltransferase family protein [Lachnospiraceae bacterium C1.1]|nr:lysophospholipid acyltransferase family protein [Lachnospiraceae bacterium C1.1]